eukprot:9475383-Pyramimonas_sp.AAC.1
MDRRGNIPALPTSDWSVVRTYYALQICSSRLTTRSTTGACLKHGAHRSRRADQSDGGGAERQRAARGRRRLALRERLSRRRPLRRLQPAGAKPAIVRRPERRSAPRVPRRSPPDGAPAGRLRTTPSSPSRRASRLAFRRHERPTLVAPQEPNFGHSRAVRAPRLQRRDGSPSRRRGAAEEAPRWCAAPC